MRVEAANRGEGISVVVLKVLKFLFEFISCIEGTASFGVWYFALIVVNKNLALVNNQMKIADFAWLWHSRVAD